MTRALLKYYMLLRRMIGAPVSDPTWDEWIEIRNVAASWSM